MVDFSNKWFREECEKNDLNPDNELSKSTVALARDCAVKMKKYMDAKGNYEDEALQAKLDEQIRRLNNERIGYMLNALFYAEVMAGLGDSYNEFVKKYLFKKERLVRTTHTSSSSLTAVEKRVNDRWEQAIQRMKGR